MGIYLDEEELWKCSKHPSKRRRTGICPTCLHDRLSTLCPHCAADRPCSCAAASAAASPSAAAAAGGLKRSRSVAIPFLRSRSRFSSGDGEFSGLTRSRSAKWFWSMFKPTKSNQNSVEEDDEKIVVEKAEKLMKSRSLAVSGDVAGAGASVDGGAKKRRGWNFVSPIKAFRQSNRTSRMFQEAVACA